MCSGITFIPAVASTFPVSERATSLNDEPGEPDVGASRTCRTSVTWTVPPMAAAETCTVVAAAALTGGNHASARAAALPPGALKSTSRSQLRTDVHALLVGFRSWRSAQYDMRSYQCDSSWGVVALSLAGELFGSIGEYGLATVRLRPNP